MTRKTIQKGDTLPYLAVQILDSNGAAYNLVGCSAKFIMTKYPSKTAVINASADITDEANGYLEYRWATGDTDVTGVYYAQFQITTTTGKKFTVPYVDKLIIEIQQDFGD